MNISIILAGGSSTRAGQNKLWAKVGDRPLWTLAHARFLEHSQIGRIVLVVPKGDELRFAALVKDEKTSIVTGGTTRMESFKKGLQSVGDFADEDIILDHNAASPMVTGQEISAVIAAAKEHGAAAVAHPVVDTVVQVTTNEDFAEKTWDRTSLRLMQTPQAVRGDVLKNAITALDPLATDLSSVLMNHASVKILPASLGNKKVTFAEDLEALTAHTFIGEDSHAFSSDGTLVLGGLTLPEWPKLEANSDGDVILHAIGRALAQASGASFSELADPLMLSGDLNSEDYVKPFLGTRKILSVSLSLECARPRIDPLMSQLKGSLADLLSISENSITFSAHTGESLTPFGQGEGIRCLASVTLLPV